MRQIFTRGWRLVYLLGVAMALLATIPAKGQGFVEDNKRYLLYNLYPYGDLDGSTQRRQVRGMEHAIINGCNAVVVSVGWGLVQPTLNGPLNWTDLDNFVAIARRYKVKIAIRVHTARDDRTGFWPEEQSMKDTRGNPVTHTRFGYTPGLEKVQEFTRIVTERYKYLSTAGELLFMSVTFNPQLENEFWQKNNPGDYPTLFDYNEFTIGDFQRWILARYNGSLDAINRAWSTNYATVGAIRPTYPDLNNNNAYSGKRGQDWYIFRHLQLKSFNDLFSATVKGVDPTIRVITEQGGIYDASSPNRGTLAFKSLSESADGVKVNDSPWATHQFAMDLVRSNVKPGGWVVNEVDGMWFREPGVADMLKAQLEVSFNSGAKMINMANFFMDYNQETLMKDLMDFVKTKRLLESPVTVVSPVGTVTYKLSTVIQSNIFESGTYWQWVSLRGSTEKPVRVILDEDVLAGLGASNQNRPPTIVNQVPEQTALVTKPFVFKIPDNTFTDADGQITGVAVTGLPTGLTYSASARTISGTATAEGSSEITVTATDNNNGYVSAYFMLLVKPNTLPLRLLDPVLDCATGQYQVRTTDGDGTPVEYAGDDLFGWSTQTSRTLADGLRYGTALTFRARQSGAEIVLRYTTTCPVVNKIPVATTPIANQTITVGRSVTIAVPDNTFTDPDGQITGMTVSGLPPGLTYSSITKTISGSIAAAGLWPITLTATDNKGATGTTSFVLSAAATQGPKPLRLIDPVIDCVTGRFEFRTADGDGSPIMYAGDDLTAWTISPTFLLVDMFRNNSLLTLRARQSGVEIAYQFRTSCPVVNKPPVVAMLVPDQAGTVNKSLSVQFATGTFTDPDGQVVSVAVTGLPPGLTYNADTRLIVGTVSTQGSWTATATATDNGGATVSTTFVIRIGALVLPLRMLPPALDCTTGLFEFRTADGDGTPIEYSIDRVYNWSTVSSLTLTAASRYTQQLDIKIRQSGRNVEDVYYPACVPPNKLPLVQEAISNQTLVQYRNIAMIIPSGTFIDTDGTISKVIVTGLPAGLVYSLSTRTISGAPTGTGSWTLTATATDNREATVTTTFVLTVVQEVKALRLLAPVFDCGSGRLEFRTADGDGTAITYSIDRIQTWTSETAITLADGVRYGTVLTLRIRQSGREQTLPYTTPCTRQNLPPVVAVRLPDQVLLVNQPASVTLPATMFADPDGNITSVTLTGLPVGLNYDPLRRAILGTPTLIGTTPVIARAFDNGGASVSDTFLITVRAVPRFSVSATMLNAQGGGIVRELADGDLLDSRKMPRMANISCQPKVAAGSVQMELTGKARRTVFANAAPYLLYPSGQGFRTETGAYQLKISVFSGANGTGTLIGTSIIKFDIVIPNEGG